jgi:hypothetical protein
VNQNPSSRGRRNSLNMTSYRPAFIWSSDSVSFQSFSLDQISWSCIVSNHAHDAHPAPKIDAHPSRYHLNAKRTASGTFERRRSSSERAVGLPAN